MAMHRVAALLLLAGILVPAWAWAAASPETLARVEMLVARYVTACNARDTAQQQALYAPQASIVHRGKAMRVSLAQSLEERTRTWRRYDVRFGSPATCDVEDQPGGAEHEAPEGGLAVRFVLPATARVLGREYRRCVPKRLIVLPGQDGCLILREESPSRETLESGRDSC